MNNLPILCFYFAATYSIAAGLLVAFLIRRTVGRRRYRVIHSIYLLQLIQLLTAACVAAYYTWEQSPILAMFWGLNLCMGISSIRNMYLSAREYKRLKARLEKLKVDFQAMLELELKK